MRLLLICISIGAVVLFQQNDYELSLDRLEIADYDKKYMENVHVKTFKYNRTHTAFNASLTLNVELGYDLSVTLQAYKFLSNEYRQFPLRFAYKICRSIARNDFGLGEMAKYGNFTGCPILKTTYYITNYTPNTATFPPHIPNGMYLIDLSCNYTGHQFATFHAYITVSRPFDKYGKSG